MTTREFFHSPGLIKSLRAGQSILVTDKGKPAVIVTKAGERPVRSRAQLEQEAAEISPNASPKVNFTAALRSQKSK